MVLEDELQLDSGVRVWAKPWAHNLYFKISWQSWQSWQQVQAVTSMVTSVTPTVTSMFCCNPHINKHGSHCDKHVALTITFLFSCIPSQYKAWSAVNLNITNVSSCYSHPHKLYPSP